MVRTLFQRFVGYTFPKGLVVILLFVRDEFMTGDTTQGVGGYQF